MIEVTNAAWTWNYAYFPRNNKYGIMKGMTGSSSSSRHLLVPHRSVSTIVVSLTLMGLLLLSVTSMTNAAAFISSDPAPKAFHIASQQQNNNNNNQSKYNENSPSVNIKINSESGTVEPFYENHAEQNYSESDNSDSSQYYDDEYYYDDNVAYTDEDLENVAASDDLHSHYFIKTNVTQVEATTNSPDLAVAAAEILPAKNADHSETESEPAAASIEDNEGSESVAGLGFITHVVQSPEIPVPPAPASNLIPTDDGSDLSDSDASSIPGTPGLDYPIFGEVPYTGFDCQKQRYKGFFADLDTQCQAWHYCDFSDGHSAFLCPNGTLFSQVLLTCDWWFNVNCKEAQQLYVLNERLYRYNKFPKPSFPEDFHGPQVDSWLIEQLQLGHLPKKRKFVTNKTVVSGNN